MRLLRGLLAATAFAALLTQPLAAQEGRQFKDAWFWGLKAGGMTYPSYNLEHGRAPSLGADWVITRTHGGLYASFDQYLMPAWGADPLGSFQDRDPSNVPFTHLVDLRNMRKITLAAMVFPRQSPKLHPYLGAGFAFNQIATAVMQGGSASTSRYAQALDSVQVKRSSFTPVVMGGVQARMPRFSVFGQASVAPTRTSFFLSNPNGRGYIWSAEAGIRYNAGSSIDKIR